MARILFVQDVLYESFGPQLLSAVLKARGHACDLLVVAAEGRRNLLRAIRSWAPDLLAFSITSFGFRWALELAVAAKSELDVATVFGGPHPTFFPRLALEPGVDYACRGEGEGAIVELAEAVEAGTDPLGIANIVWATDEGELVTNPLRPLVGDLDSVPFPDRELHFKHRPLRTLSYKRFLVGRGCPYGCTYCFNRAAQEMYRGLGRYVRHRSPENVVAEILEVERRWGLETVGFVDDTFTTDKRWLLAFLALYREQVGVPFTCLTRINEIDEEIAEALAAAGCHYASFGLEVGNETLRNRVLGRRMSDAEIRTKSALLHRVGIPFLTFNMFGVPGETADDGVATIRLNAEIGSDLIGTSMFTPFVGTEIFATCQREGFLDEGFDVESLDRITATSPLRNLPDLAFLANLQKIGFIAVRFPRLLGLVVAAARLPLGPLYRLAYTVSLFFRYKVRFRLSTWEVLRLGFGSRGRFG